MIKEMNIILQNTMTYRNGQWSEVASQLYELKVLLRELEKREKDLTDHLKDLSENTSAQDGILQYTFDFREGSIDYKNIPELKTVNLDLYRKAPTRVWKLSKI